MKEFVYTVGCLLPSEEEGFNAWAFDARIGWEFARLSRDRIMSDKILGRMNNLGREIVRRFGFEYDTHINPYVNMEGSCLLQAVMVPGDACDLSLDEEGLRDFGDDWERRKKSYLELENAGQYIAPTRYVPHNLDFKNPAFCLVSLWNNWMEVVEANLQK